MLEQPCLAIDKQHPPETHESFEIVPVLLFLSTTDLLQLQAFEHRIELVVEGEDEAESFNELIDFLLELLIFQVDFANDLLQVEHKLIQIVERLESLR